MFLKPKLEKFPDCEMMELEIQCTSLPSKSWQQIGQKRRQEKDFGQEVLPHCSDLALDNVFSNVALA